MPNNHSGPLSQSLNSTARSNNAQSRLGLAPVASTLPQNRFELTEEYDEDDEERELREIGGSILDNIPKDLNGTSY